MDHEELHRQYVKGRMSDPSGFDWYVELSLPSDYVPIQTPRRVLSNEELDTVNNPSRRFRDETQRVHCGACGNWLTLGGMFIDAAIQDVSMKHLELCHGDAAETLEAVKRWYAGLPASTSPDRTGGPTLTPQPGTEIPG